MLFCIYSTIELFDVYAPSALFENDFNILNMVITLWVGKNTQVKMLHRRGSLCMLQLQWCIAYTLYIQWFSPEPHMRAVTHEP